MRVTLAIWENSDVLSTWSRGLFFFSFFFPTLTPFSYVMILVSVESLSTLFTLDTFPMNKKEIHTFLDFLIISAFHHGCNIHQTLLSGAFLIVGCLLEPTVFDILKVKFKRSCDSCDTSVDFNSLEWVTQRNCGCFIPEDIQDQAEWGPGQAWTSAWQPCPWQGAWNYMIFKVTPPVTVPHHSVQPIKAFWLGTHAVKEEVEEKP